MIVKEAKGSSNNAYFVIPEDADDLFTLRRVVERGDYVTADTTRVIKQTKEYSRPDKGERVKVRITIRTDGISLDDVVDRLRIAGSITNTDNELVPRGSHHAITVQAGDMITIDKDRRWKDVEISILKKSTNNTTFILVAIDTQEAAVAKVSGTHVKMIPNIYSGSSGKRYQTKSNASIEVYFADIAKTILSILGEDDKVIIFGPGETRRRFYNMIVDKYEIKKESVSLIDGVDVAGEDGIFVFLRSPAIKQAMSTSKIAAVSSMLDQVMHFVHRNENRYAMGLAEVSNAAAARAVESLVFSDSIFKTSDEDNVVKLLNSVEANGAKTFAVDSSTDIGLRVSSLGGVVAILRYAMR